MIICFSHLFLRLTFFHRKENTSRDIFNDLTRSILKINNWFIVVIILLDEILAKNFRNRRIILQNINSCDEKGHNARTVMQYYFNIDIPVAYFIRIVYYVYITFNPLAKHFAPGTLNWFQLMLSSVILLFSA